MLPISLHEKSGCFFKVQREYFTMNMLKQERSIVYGRIWRKDKTS